MINKNKRGFWGKKLILCSQKPPVWGQRLHGARVSDTEDPSGAALPPPFSKSWRCLSTWSFDFASKSWQCYPGQVNTALWIPFPNFSYNNFPYKCHCNFFELLLRVHGRNVEEGANMAYVSDWERLSCYAVFCSHLAITGSLSVPVLYPAAS